jgi:hypothetical protein
MGMEKTSKPFDNGAKRLIKISAQELLDWFAPGARFTGQFSEQFHCVEIEADAMIEARCNGLSEIVHFEFQSGPDPDMAQRLLEYYTLAYGRYRCSVRCYVIYLRKSGTPPQSPLIRVDSNGQEVLRFHFYVILLWKIPHRVILDQNKWKLFPLVPLMDGGARLEVIEEIITRLLPMRDTIVGRDLLTVTSLFASLAFTAPKDKEWCKRRFAMLKDIFEGTPQHQYYKDLVRDEVESLVREEVSAEVRAQALEEERRARLREERELLLMIVKAHFPTLTRLAKTQAELIKDVAVMKEVLGKVGTAQTTEEAKNALVSWLLNDEAEV